MENGRCVVGADEIVLFWHFATVKYHTGFLKAHPPTKNIAKILIFQNLYHILYLAPSFASFIYSRVHINTSQIGCWGSNHLKFGTGDLEELLNEKIYSIFNSSPERQLFWKYMRLKRAQWLDSCKWFALVCFFTRFIFLAIFWSDF